MDRKYTVSHILGEMVWLLSQSPLYRRLTIADLEAMVMPPILHQQFRIFRKDDKPFAFALWAHLSEEVETRLIQSQKNQQKFSLQPDEWKSGERLWLIELVSPFHTDENKLNDMLVADLTQKIFDGREFKFLRFEAKV